MRVPVYVCVRGVWPSLRVLTRHTKCFAKNVLEFSIVQRQQLTWTFRSAGVSLSTPSHTHTHTKYMQMQIAWSASDIFVNAKHT